MPPRSPHSRSSRNGDGYRGDRGDTFGLEGSISGPGVSKFKRFAGASMQRKCDDANDPLDYKNLTLLQKYLSPQGKMQSRKRTKYCAQCQRLLARAVKQARFLALLPYVV
jgi:small subunit ribosomal protein S18